MPPIPLSERLRLKLVEQVRGVFNDVESGQQPVPPSDEAAIDFLTDGKSEPVGSSGVAALGPGGDCVWSIKGAATGLGALPAGTSGTKA